MKLVTLISKSTSKVDRHSLDSLDLPPPFFLKKEEGVNFDYLLQRVGGSEKLKKGVEVWCRGTSS